MQGIKDLSKTEIEHSAGGAVSAGVRSGIDATAARAGSRSLAYPAAIDAGIGLSAVGVGALAAAGVARNAYDVCRLARAFT
ncbi:hypothetical protein [Rhizobium sullae]|uniref:hypothetical protein n=1 Tax=Rhizobium sullae TaxID=50338 RepID=UPI00042992A5|nr:hypothetical protein [Rhizobium sullae]